MNETIAATLDRLTLGEPRTFRSLSMFPLLARDGAEPGYLTLEEALRDGHARITEVSEAGSVPELLVENPSPHRVLLLDGDELVGAKQNRVLNVTILVAPRSKLLVPVSCVERGRWHRRSAEFRSEGRMMFARGRAAKMAQVTASMRDTGSRRSDQRAVWAQVGAKAVALAAESPTEAMSDVYRQVSASTGDYRRALSAEPGQVGAVFAIDGRPVGLELLDAPRTLGAVLGRLVESYALDAIERPERLAPEPEAETARGFLARAAAARAESVKAVGEGEEVRLEAEGMAGGALVADGRLVHLSALATR
jgi:hypothetical protein